MEFVKLGNSDLNVSRICLGCMGFGDASMESYDFKGKTVIPFATSGGSSIKKAYEDLKAAYPDITWKEGKLLNNASKKVLEDWVKAYQ